MGNAIKQKLKHQIMFAWCLHIGAAGQLFNLAQRDGECWDLIKDLYDGKAQPLQNGPKGKSIATPTSYNPFVAAMTLQDNVLAVLLKQLLDGSIDVPMFKTRCTRTKWTGLVMDDTCKFVQIKAPQEVASALAEAGKAADAPLTWAILQRRWPDIDDALVEKWVDFLMHKKSLKLKPDPER